MFTNTERDSPFALPRMWLNSPLRIFFVGHFNWRILINIADSDIEGKPIRPSWLLCPFDLIGLKLCTKFCTPTGIFYMHMTHVIIIKWGNTNWNFAVLVTCNIQLNNNYRIPKWLPKGYATNCLIFNNGFFLWVDFNKLRIPSGCQLLNSIPVSIPISAAEEKIGF